MASLQRGRNEWRVGTSAIPTGRTRIRFEGLDRPGIPGNISIRGSPFYRIQICSQATRSGSCVTASTAVHIREPGLPTRDSVVEIDVQCGEEGVEILIRP